MKVLAAKKKTENKIRYYNGKYFVIGKKNAIDISNNSEETINKYIEALYKYLETTFEKDTIDYFVMEI